MRDEQVDQASEHRPAPVVRPDRQQAQLADAATRRQVRIDVPELLVEGERPLPPNRQHADDRVVVYGDEVGVLVVETVDVAAVGVRRVLRDFLDEGVVGELEDLLEFRWLRRYPVLHLPKGHDGAGL